MYHSGQHNGKPAEEQERELKKMVDPKAQVKPRKLTLGQLFHLTPADKAAAKK